MAKKKSVYTYSFQFYKDHIHREVDLRLYASTVFYIHVTDQDSGEAIRIPCKVNPKAYKKELLQHVKSISSENLIFTTYLNPNEIEFTLYSFVEECEYTENLKKETEREKCYALYDSYVAEHGKPPPIGYNFDKK